MVPANAIEGGPIILVDQYDLALSTTSSAARDAYVQGSSLLLTLYPGAIEAFDRAIATAPGFALAHARKAQVLMREGNVAAARARCRRPRMRPPICRRVRPATSRSSILRSRVEWLARSPGCMNI